MIRFPIENVQSICRSKLDFCSANSEIAMMDNVNYYHIVVFTEWTLILRFASFSVIKFVIY